MATILILMIGTILSESRVSLCIYIYHEEDYGTHSDTKAKKARLTRSDLEFTYVYSSLPPQRVFTRLLNVRSTCLVRSHSRCEPKIQLHLLSFTSAK